MKVSGEEAKQFVAVRLDSFVNANKGELIEADEETGKVEWRDTPESTKSITLGPRAIKITRKGR